MPRISKSQSVAIFLMLAFVTGAVCLLLGYRIATAQRAARESQLRGKFAQLRVALLNYHDATGSFPVVRAPGNTAGESWRVRLLPYVEMQDVHERIQLDEPWNSPRNLALAQQVRIPLFYAMADDEPTTEFALCHPEDLLGERPLLTLPVRAGDDTMILVFTPDSTVHWLDPRDAGVNHSR